MRALRDFARATGYEPNLLTAVDEVNTRAKGLLLEELRGRLGDLSGRVIALWGLAFKPKTSDTREAPAQVLIHGLLAAGASVRASDPRAIEETRAALGDLPNVTYVADPYEAARGADALAVVTEWDIYRQPDFARLRSFLRTPIIVDGRNVYSREEMARAGFDYLSVGRPPVLAASGPAGRAL